MRNLILLFVILFGVNTVFSANIALLNKNRPIKLISYLALMNPKEQINKMTDADYIAHYIIKIVEVCYNLNVEADVIMNNIFKVIKNKSAKKEAKRKIYKRVSGLNRIFRGYVLDELYKKLLNATRVAEGNRIVVKDVPYKKLIGRTLRIMQELRKQFRSINSVIVTSENVTSDKNDRIKFISLNSASLKELKLVVKILVKLDIVKHIKPLKKS